jgi:hypothetical protein
MRPTPADLAAGIRTVLRESIAPELKSANAQLQLRRVMSILREARWNHAAFDILHENAKIVLMLQRCHAALVAAEALGPIPDVVRRWLDGARPHLTTLPLPRTFDEANSINFVLRQMLAQSIELMSAQPGLVASDLRDSFVGEFLALNSASDA